MNYDQFGGNSTNYACDTTDEELSTSAVLHTKSFLRSYHVYKYECNPSIGDVFKFGHNHYVRYNV